MITHFDLNALRCQDSLVQKSCWIYLISLFPDVMFLQISKYNKFYLHCFSDLKESYYLKIAKYNT